IEFYYRYIEGINEEQKHETNIETSSLGTIIHEVLEDIYAPFIGRFLNLAFLEQIITQIPRLVKYKYLILFGGKEVGGKNLLSKLVAEKHIANAIFQDIDCIKNNQTIKIVNLELRCEKFVSINGKH